MADTLATNRRIRLHEYGKALVLQIGDIDLHVLSEANNRWKRILGLSSNPIRVEDLGNGYVKLRAEAVTGVIRVGNTDIEIVPKFLSAVNDDWQAVLWQILMVAEGGYVDEHLTAARHNNSLSIPDLLAEMFLASYARGGARGLPRSYTITQGSGGMLRGQLDVSRLNDWLARPWMIPYTTDYLDDNTGLARLLRWSADCLAATVKSAGRARALREISSGLAHVGRVPPSLFEALRLTLGPQHQGLESARLVGLLLLEGGGVDHANGEYSLSGFLWNSDTIYENYVYWLCRRAANLCGSRVSKDELNFGQVVNGIGSKLKTTPDVVFSDKNGRPLAITDAKYKLLGSRPKAGDTYQVLTAGHVLGCQRVSLTYPVATSREPTVWKVSSALGGSDIELTAIPLNLMKLSLPRGHDALIQALTLWLKGGMLSTA